MKIKKMKEIGRLIIIFIMILLPLTSFSQRDFYIDLTLEEVKELHPDLKISSDSVGTIAQFKIEDHITYSVVFDKKSDKSIGLVLYVENKTRQYDERFVHGYSHAEIIKSHSNLYRVDQKYILEYDILLVRIQPFNPVENDE